MPLYAGSVTTLISLYKNWKYLFFNFFFSIFIKKTYIVDFNHLEWFWLILYFKHFTLWNPIIRYNKKKEWSEWSGFPLSFFFTLKTIHFPKGRMIRIIWVDLFLVIVHSWQDFIRSTLIYAREANQEFWQDSFLYSYQDS